MAKKTGKKLGRAKSLKKVKPLMVMRKAGGNAAAGE